MHRTFALAGLAVAACAAPTPVLRGSIVDLTHAFDADTIYWPTEEGFVLERGPAGRRGPGHYYEAHRFRAAEHGGTHLDAPIHFYEGRWTVDQIPLEKLVGRGVMVDVSEQCAADRDHRISVQDLAGWESVHGRIPEGAIVLLHTGFARFWPDRSRYMGTARRGAEAVSQLRFPGLHPDAARWLTEERRISAVGLDTPSIDFGRSDGFETHVTLFEANVPAFENLARLDRLPPVGFVVVALPMKIRGGSGSPLRIVAILESGA